MRAARYHSQIDLWLLRGAHGTQDFERAHETSKQQSSDVDRFLDRDVYGC
jgi:hypothetical protein